jgi:hypothetical protein
MKKMNRVEKLEYLMRRKLRGAGARFDETLGLNSPDSMPDVSVLIAGMERLIEERVDAHGVKADRREGLSLRLRLRVPFESEVSGGDLAELRDEIAAAAAEYIAYNGLGVPVPDEVEVVKDIYADRAFVDVIVETRGAWVGPAVRVTARVSSPEGGREIPVEFVPGGRVGVGRAGENALVLPYRGVSKFHAVMLLRPDGALVLADAGSANGTYINGRRMSYGETHALGEGDTVAFGTVAVSFLREVEPT